MFDFHYNVVFQYDSKGKALGKGKNIHYKFVSKDVSIVENLCYNLISLVNYVTIVTQLNIINTFALSTLLGDIMLTGLREQNTYNVNWNDDNHNTPTCFVAINGNKYWLMCNQLNA